MEKAGQDRNRSWRVGRKSPAENKKKKKKKTTKKKKTKKKKKNMHR